MALSLLGSGVLRGTMPFGSHHVNPSHVENVVFKREGEMPFHFDESKLGMFKPPLGEVQGYNLGRTDLEEIFGINEERLGALPAQMVVTDLEGRHTVDDWYETFGYLYIVKPMEWVPEVSNLETLPASIYITQHDKEQETVVTSELNAGTDAEISIKGRGSYYGVTAEAKSTSTVSYKYAKSTTTKESLKTSGKTGEEPVHNLAVYPLLKCKVLKRQRIEYTINDSSEELKWSPDSSQDGYWNERFVNSNLLREVRKATIHPVPMVGEGLGNKAYILPVPQVSEAGDLEIVTIMSREGWKDWYRYDAYAWEDLSDGKELTLAVPNNNVAFRPTATWTTIPALKRG